MRALAAQLALSKSALFYYAVAFTGLVYTALYLVHQRYFPYWDGSAYEQFTLTVADAFSSSLGTGVARVVASLSDDYNFLFTVPLVPFVDAFGRYRAVFIGAMYLCFFVPYMLLAALVARRVFPEYAREAGRFAAVAAFLTPSAWWHLAIGYPDVGGAAVIAAMLLLYDRSDRGRRWRPLLAVAVLGALAILFRRHYVYAVFAVYAAFVVDTLWPLGVEVRERMAQLRHALLVVGAGAVTGALLFVAAPTFVSRALGSGYQQSLASWQAPPSVIASAVVGTVGVLPLLIAIAGMIGVRRLTVRGRSMARVLAYAVVIWALLWVFYVRQGPAHYPHILPLFVVVGLTGAWLSVRHLAGPTARRFGAPALAALLVFVLLVSVPVAQPALVLSAAVPRPLFPDAARPPVNPAYDDITVLVGYLRAHTTPSDRILVGASSPVLNYDILTSAERTLYGPDRTKLDIPFAPQVDSRDAPPLSDLVNANIVIVAHPFQHHLAPEQQKVVSVVDTAFDEHWSVARDFTELPERFTLGEPGTDVEVYKRVRPDAPPVVADLQKRMTAYTQREATAYTPAPGSPAVSAPPSAGGTAAWVERSSPYPMVIAPSGKGAYTFTGHPARADQQPTVLETQGGSAKKLTISGTVHLFDDHCAGLEIAAGTDYRPGARGASAGVFVPQHNDVAFKIVVPNVRGKAVYLNLRPNPANPERIEFCTTRIDRLEAVPG